MIDLTIAEIKEYYPVTDSLTQAKINDLTKFVKNNIFIQMFGLAISKEIFDLTILDSASVNFIGFRKFLSLCVANELIKNSYIHTNAGLKIVNQQNWQTPTMQQKVAPLNDLSATIENQFLEAKKILVILGKISNNEYQSYGSFKIIKI